MVTLCQETFKRYNVQIFNIIFFIKIEKLAVIRTPARIPETQAVPQKPG
jgi:hypothetical protein